VGQIPYQLLFFVGLAALVSLYAIFQSLVALIRHKEKVPGEEIKLGEEPALAKMLRMRLKLSLPLRQKPSDAEHLVWLQEKLGKDVHAAIVLHTGPLTYELGHGVLAMPISTI
jgi:hypothetical protein